MVMIELYRHVFDSRTYLFVMFIFAMISSGLTARYSDRHLGASDPRYTARFSFLFFPLFPGQDGCGAVFWLSVGERSTALHFMMT